MTSVRRGNSSKLNAVVCKDRTPCRSSVMRAFSFLLLAACVSSPGPAQSTGAADAPSAAQLFHAGRFREAVAIYRERIGKDPSSATLRAGLVQGLLKLDEVQSADDESTRSLAALPKSALLHAVRGDLLFRKGQMLAAELEYRAALALDGQCARAWFGMGRMEALVSHRGHARAAFTRAHELDPEDGDALYRWALLLPYPQNVVALERHLKEYRADVERERRESEYIAFLKALAGRHVWVPPPGISRQEIKLENIATAGAIRGMGVRVKFNGGPTQTLLLDTGAAWITISRKLAEKAGARKLSDLGMEGTGDSGPVAGYFAWVDRITIGDMEFHDCVVQVSMKDIAGPQDGALGLQMFTGSIITLDFPTHRLRLAPLPDSVEAANDGPDKLLVQAPTGDRGPAQLFSFGHLLLLPTTVNDRAEGLFILDTGANTNSITPGLARQVGHLRNSKVTVSGNNGEVYEVFIAEGISLQFSHLRQPREDMVSYGRHSLSKDLETEVSGFIGLPSLNRKKVTLNYRDGVVEVE